MTTEQTLQDKLRNFGDQSDIHDENQMMRIAADRIDQLEQSLENLSIFSHDRGLQLIKSENQVKELERQLAEAQKDQARWNECVKVAMHWIEKDSVHCAAFPSAQGIFKSTSERFIASVDTAIAQQKVEI